MASLEKFRLSQVSWDSDKDPGKFMEFMYLMSSLVRATAHGHVLEDYLDAKLGRCKFHQVTTPGFLSEDPEFRRPESPHEEEDEDSVNSSPLAARIRAQAARSEARESPSSPGGQASTSASGSAKLNHIGMNYFDLDLEARELDGTLFNVLRLAVKGAKNIMLDCVQFPSYVQGIIVLFRHADISKNDRITRAFESMDALSFNGDALVWQSEAMRKTRELFDSGASIMHYVLSRGMKSFDGKLKTIQYKIAEDINRTVINDHTNVFDMVQSYAADIASVGDSKAPAMQVQSNGNASSATCGFCNFQGHTEDQCRKKKAAMQSLSGSSNSSAASSPDGNSKHAHYSCHRCGKKGHVSKSCPEKATKNALQVAAEKAAPAAAVAPAAPADPVHAPAPVGQIQAGSVSQEGLSALLRHLQASMNQSRVY